MSLMELYKDFSTDELRRRVSQLESAVNSTLSRLSVVNLLELRNSDSDDLNNPVHAAVKFTEQVFAKELICKEIFRREFGHDLPEDDEDDDSGTTIRLCDDPPPSGDNAWLPEPILQAA